MVEVRQRLLDELRPAHRRPEEPVAAHEERHHLLGLPHRRRECGIVVHAQVAGEEDDRAAHSSTVRGEPFLGLAGTLPRCIAGSSGRVDDRDEMSEQSLEMLALYEIEECKRIVRLQLLVVLAVLAVTLVGVGAALLATELPWGHSVPSAAVAWPSTR